MKTLDEKIDNLTSLINDVFGEKIIAKKDNVGIKLTAKNDP